MTEKEKMLRGELYDSLDGELVSDHDRAERLFRRFNAGESDAVMHELLAAVGERTIIRRPFRCDYGYNITLGSRVFLNFGCVLLDVCSISVGDGCQIGPGVHIYAADHPRDMATRRQGLEFGRPVRLGEEVWVGGGALILPGVTVGDGAVIGAGSVVTRDVPAGATVMGNPARVRADTRAGAL